MNPDDQLRVIAEIVGVCDQAGMAVWLRGGWAMDFFLGEVTRPHRDVDLFCAARDADRLVTLLHARGYRDDPGPYADPPRPELHETAISTHVPDPHQPAGSPLAPQPPGGAPSVAVPVDGAGGRRPAPEQQRDLVSPDGVDVGIALFARDRDGCPTVAGGPYAGERWPPDLLDGPLACIEGVRCRIVSPRAQIEIKRMMPVWVPGLPRRTKDAADIARLQAALDKGAPHA
ncbi:nucleotidyltransferase domain-containing protein [Actinoplanes sp. NPDC049681]|uniref:nucleotidyltransferase domain-containing protein n=1 Tax=Actinoplanes sp. NPDC049681 TaxID=3363905 RepID=UPI0037ACDDAC